MLEHISHYSKDNNPNAIFYVDDQIAVDLFPYKIKDRERFYDRNHIENVNPESLTYQKYWFGFLEKCIEGKWVEDANGVWVFVMPKLFYYINYVEILDEDRKKIKPDLCDLEWIFFTYFLCLDGFSGFEDDTIYTCNRLIERIEISNDPKVDDYTKESISLNEMELNKIPESCFTPSGEYKKFVEPWDYLTRTYLIDAPRGPLGRALYENKRKNGFILGARAIRKSFTVYMGDFMHEWTFSGVRRMEDLKQVNSPLLFAMGSGSADQMNRTIKNIRGFYDNQPGKYRFQDKDVPDWLGPFYKNYQGKLEVGKEFQHVIKGVNNIVELFGSTVQVSVIRPDRTRIVAGDRFRRVYIEEVGFIEYILEVFSSNIDSLKLGNNIVGSWIATGTGGDMEAIIGSKKMFENPDGFNIQSIPYYWKNPEKRIGLFIPAQYQKRDLDDGNGFIYLDLATKEILKERQQWYENLDSVSAGSRIMYNPIQPDEMLIPSSQSVLPKKEAQLRLSDIEARDIFKKTANIGTLNYDSSYPNGVRFDKDLSNRLEPITEYILDNNKVDLSGAFIMYEPPPSGKIPRYMYWVIYDPAAQSGEGTSLHSILVYKHFLTTDSGAMKDTIVAEWIGRLPTLEENYDLVIKVARYFGAMIFPETNIAGFVEWAIKNNYGRLLQRDSYALQKEISPGSKRSHYKAGFRMMAREKWWALQRLASWLLEWKTFDKDGFPEYRNIDFINSPRILNEIVYYNDADNFDHISSMLGLMLLLGQLDDLKPASDEDLDEDDWKEPIIHRPIEITRRRSNLEKF